MGQLVSEASAALSTLIHSEIELAKLELKSSVRVGIASIAAFIAAGILLLFGLIYGFQAIAEALALTLPRWAAFLIVFGGFVVLAVLLVIFGVKRIKRVAPPKQTIKTTRETVDYLKKSRS
jgi:TRAP-type C4-dicarboxylate transport system permease small subunit